MLLHTAPSSTLCTTCRRHCAVRGRLREREREAEGEGEGEGAGEGERERGRERERERERDKAREGERERERVRERDRGFDREGLPVVRPRQAVRRRPVRRQVPAPKFPVSISMILFIILFN